jgi:hypothetical protein
VSPGAVGQAGLVELWQVGSFFVSVGQVRLVRLGPGVLGALCSVMSWFGRWGGVVLVMVVRVLVRQAR